MAAGYGFAGEVQAQGRAGLSRWKGRRAVLLAEGEGVSCQS